MSDRELLENAAKAAGIEVMRSRLDDTLQRDMLVKNSARNSYHENGPWNPLTDDGDALRLAVKLGILVFTARSIATANAADRDGPCIREMFKDDADQYAATRRAIVRAASEIGKAMA